MVATGAALPEQAHQKGAFFKTVAKQYVGELRAAGLEETKGIEDKEATYAAFVEEFENPRIGSVTKELVGTFKAIGLKTAGMGGLRHQAALPLGAFPAALHRGASRRNRGHAAGPRAARGRHRLLRHHGGQDHQQPAEGAVHKAIKASGFMAYLAIAARPPAEAKCAQKSQAKGACALAFLS